MIIDNKYPIIILNTDILLDDNFIIDKLNICNIIISYTIIEQMDDNKDGMEVRNYNARSFLKYISDIGKDENLYIEGIERFYNCKLFIYINNLLHLSLLSENIEKDNDKCINILSNIYKIKSLNKTEIMRFLKNSNDNILNNLSYDELVYLANSYLKAERYELAIKLS